ncbi:hypothetical protein Q1695_010057 [Nippostrongylus brasiliensis]|nr:hypothetical protein Q1695_010057 [Nippostrongylus brasiliensis]
MKRAQRIKDRSPGLVTCPVCHEQFLDQERFAGHCYEKHRQDGADGEEQDYTHYSLEFQSEAIFKIWLRDKCETTVTSLYKKNTSRRFYHLRCNRAGKFRCKGEDRIKPTKKNVAFCSCYVNVYVHDDGSVLMKGCFGHIGHSVDPALLRLSDYQKDFLKSLLEKYPMDDVICQLKKDFSPKTSRLYFVTRKDCYNLLRKHGMEPRSPDSSHLKAPIGEPSVIEGGPLERINPKSPERGIMVDKMTNLKASDADQWNESEREAVEGN